MRRPLPISAFPQVPVTVGIILLSVVVTTAWWSGASVDPLVVGVGSPYHTFWGFFTSTFPHANVLHLVFNIYWMWVFGCIIEQAHGRLRFAGMVAVLAVASGLPQVTFSDPGIGLSGVGYGLFAYLWWRSRRDARFADCVDTQTIALFVAWFFLCLFTTASGTWLVANHAHAGGALGGFLLAAAVSVPRRRWLATAGFVLYLSLLTVLPAVGQSRLNQSDGYQEHRAYELGRRAYDALAQENNDEAITLLEEAVRLNDDEPTLWFNLGIAYQRIERYEEALRAYDRAAAHGGDESEYRETAEAMREFVTATRRESE